ncbi:MAG: T9SS type A sorting domain-containing protein [Bacteroidales bacterium]|nr:T9SS type A sorting domain-containing protein [Candidatus Scybalousia scybalohippi]
MKNHLCFLLIALASLHCNAQNITVSSASGQNPSTFINTELLGEGVYVFNIKYNNSNGNIATDQIGTFNSNGYTGLGMDSGIVMTTGNVNVAPGPNNSSSMSSPISGYYTDNLMNSYASGSLNACSTLDFDFIGLSSHISFKYFFASEEYPEYVASTYNDVFAFILTGPDPNTYEETTKNIAMIPGSISASNPDGIAVAINSVNPGTPGSSGSSSTPGFYSQYSYLYVDNPSGSQGVQYDGHTTKLTASADIIPCETYHIHISICNVGDNGFDSGVFLEESSLNSPAYDYGFTRDNDTIEVGCSLGVPINPFDGNYSFSDVNVSFGGDAICGTDYEFSLSNGTTITDSGSFSLIDDYVTRINVKPLASANISEPKTAEIYFASQFCSNMPSLIRYDTMRLVIIPAKEYTLMDTTIVCQDTCFHVGVEYTGDCYSPLSFQWNPKAHLVDPYAQSTECGITESMDYLVMSQDRYGCKKDTAIVHVIVNKDDTVGLNSVEAVVPEINIYPNPTKDETTLRISGITGNVEITISDINGKIIDSEDFTCDASCTKHLNLKNLTPGTYFIGIKSETNSTTRKIIIEQ